MDIAPGLDVALMRRAAEHAERSADLRAQRQREEVRRPAVEFGGALSHLNEDEEVREVDASATSDRTREKEDPPHLVDVVA